MRSLVLVKNSLFSPHFHFFKVKIPFQVIVPPLEKRGCLMKLVLIVLSLLSLSSVQAYTVKTAKELKDKKLEVLALKFKEICSELNTDLEYCEAKRVSLNNVVLEQDGKFPIAPLRDYVNKFAMELTSDNYDDVMLIAKYLPFPGSENDRRQGRTTPNGRFNSAYQEAFSKLSNQDKAKINKLKSDIAIYVKSETHRMSFFFNDTQWSSYDGFFVVDDKNQEALIITSIQVE